ncbi:U2 small nuclear ribonucleoprotein auxiliary factor 35 kDa subunit-related protein 2-like isoform X2 [Oscarella lobularis]|uniref:U2 small nuclear ribonucleoprotein auxiliary factor 35 kDa subunit-related protein 2-like isoform X2 n=1 Tax=Oscarella lobularis TaxID=121494 RepID=UPI0033143211
MNALSVLEGTSNRKDRRKALKKERRRTKRQILARTREEEEASLEAVSGHELKMEESERKLEEQDRLEEIKSHEEKLLWLEREKEFQRKLTDEKVDIEVSASRGRESEGGDALHPSRRSREATDDECEGERTGEEGKKRRQEEETIVAPRSPPRETWHNPSAPDQTIADCSFYAKTGACRYGERCSRHHSRPVISRTLLIANMFSSVELDQQVLDEIDHDVELEYDEREAYEKFVDFYADIRPAFEEAGNVVNLMVCCNYEPHLRGNVYVEYAREEEASRAFAAFNGRWYAQKQLSVQYCPVTDWKSAVCGLFHRRRCPKGKHCSFLHVFSTPSRDSERRRRRHRHRHRHRSSRSRSRSRSRRRSRSRERRHRRKESRRRRRRSRSDDDDDDNDDSRGRRRRRHHHHHSDCE